MSGSVLVTGGAGFVGSGLVRELLRRGDEVIVLDNMLRGSRDNLPEADGLEIVEGDIRSAEDLARALARKPSQVVHLAAHHYIPYCNEHPADTINVNVFGTQVVLSEIANAGCVEKFVFASTAAVYGPSDEKHAESEAMAPIDIYGLSKQIGEQQVRFFHDQTGIPSSNARLFNVIGPRETNPHLLPDIFDQLPEAKVLKLGNLVPKRDYIYVDDIASGIVALLESDIAYESVNLGTGSAYSAKEMVEMIDDIAGYGLEINSVAEKQRAGDRPFLCADNARLKELGWNNRYDIRESLTRTMQEIGLLPA